MRKNSLPPPSEISEDVLEGTPAKKKFDLDDITATISYMQDIKDRLKALDKEKEDLLEKINDIEAEKNQLTNEYSQLRTEVIDSL